LDPAFARAVVRAAAAALIRPLAWELTYAMGMVKKDRRKQTNNILKKHQKTKTPTKETNNQGSGGR